MMGLLMRDSSSETNFLDSILDNPKLSSTEYGDTMGTLKLDLSLAGFEDKANEAAQMLKALSNEKRLMILCKLLEHREMSVNALIDHVWLSQSALSQHLARMREEKLVDTRRDAQQIFYRVADPRVRRILSTLKTVYC